MPKVSAPLKISLLVLLVFLFSLYVSLPAKIPVNINLRQLAINTTYQKPDIDIRIGRWEVKKTFNLVLGLDLAGGSHLVFEAETKDVPAENKKEALESAKNIIEQRVNFFGVSEPNVQVSNFAGGDRIIVELPGVSDAKTASSIIGQTSKLEFREFIRLSDATISATLANTKPTGLTGADFVKAQATFSGDNGTPVVSFTIKSGESSKKFGEVTTQLKGKPLAIFLDSMPISWPTVQDTITESGQISGNFSVEGAKKFAQ